MVTSPHLLDATSIAAPMLAVLKGTFFFGLFVGLMEVILKLHKPMVQTVYIGSRLECVRRKLIF